MARLGGLALLVELGSRAEAAIGGTILEEAIRVGLVAGQIRSLMHDLLVPRPAEPAEPVVDRPCALLRGARDADVQIARGAGREAEAMCGRHDREKSKRAHPKDGPVTEREGFEPSI